MSVPNQVFNPELGPGPQKMGKDEICILFFKVGTLANVGGRNYHMIKSCFVSYNLVRTRFLYLDIFKAVLPPWVIIVFSAARS